MPVPKYRVNDFPKDVTKILNLAKELSLDSLFILATEVTKLALINEEKERVATELLAATLPPDAAIVNAFTEVKEFKGDAAASGIEAVFGLVIPVTLKGAGVLDADKSASGDKQEKRHGTRERKQRVLDGQSTEPAIVIKPKTEYTNLELSYSRTPDKDGTYTLVAKYGGLAVSVILEEERRRRKYGADFRRLLENVGRDIGIAEAPAADILRLFVPGDSVWRDVTLWGVNDVNDQLGGLKISE